MSSPAQTHIRDPTPNIKMVILVSSRINRLFQVFLFFKLFRTICIALSTVALLA